MMSREDSLAAEALRWEASAAKHERAGDKGGAQFARDQAAIIWARVRERQQLRSAGVRFG
jgi:hypothetical protein